MNKLVETLEKYIVPVAFKLGEQKHLNAIKSAFLRIMPLTLIGAIFVLINNVLLKWDEGSFFWTLGIHLSDETIRSIAILQAPGNLIISGTLGILSLLTPFALAYSMAEERKVDTFAAGVIAIGAFIMLLPHEVVAIINGIANPVGGAISTSFFGGGHVFAGMIIGLVTGEVFALLTKKNITIRLPESVPPAVSKAFSALIPGVIILLFFGILGTILEANNTTYPEIIMNTISKPLSQVGPLVGWLYVFFAPLLFFFGIHGPQALGAIDSGILTPFALNNMDAFLQYGSVAAAEQAGYHFNLWAKPLCDAYIALGGQGATLGLLIAIFIASRRAGDRSIAKLGIAPGIFQINEPVIFGLPIVMNPLYFIPFIIIQPILALVVTIAYNLHVIPPVTNMIPWVMPVGLGAFFATNGSIPALITSLVCLAISTIVYLPFVIAGNKFSNKTDETSSGV